MAAVVAIRVGITTEAVVAAATLGGITTEAAVAATTLGGTTAEATAGVITITAAAMTRIMRRSIV